MINKIVEELLIYAEKNLYLNKEDIVYKRNILLDLLNQNEPYIGEIDKNYIFSLDRPDILFDELINEGVSEKLAIRIFGELSPLPSAINENFYSLKSIAPRDATSYFYDLCVKNYYVQKSKIDKNINSVSSNGIELSINLSKPEKNNADIKKALLDINVTYPKCAICKDNVGFKGEGKFLPRGNLRTIDFDLDGSKWFFQYSPYGYFDEHFILVKDEHTPMKLSDENIKSLFLFIKQFPHYVIGSNSDLPISGGSILTHEHFQGGKHIFPIMKRNYLEKYKFEDTNDVDIYKLDWFASTLVVAGKEHEKVFDVSKKIIRFYENYSDENIGLISKDKEQHNSVTLLLQYIDNEYRLFIVFRNNIVNEQYPDGVFHAHKEYHIIKKEGIGLIEEGGRFILPARLERQFKQIKDIILNNYSFEEYTKKYPDMVDFKDFIDLVKNYYDGSNLDNVLNEVTGKYCENILRNTSVFKNDKQGEDAFNAFIKKLGLTKCEKE